MAYACLSEVYDLALGMSRKGGEPTLTTCSKNHRLWQASSVIGFLSTRGHSENVLRLVILNPTRSLVRLQHFAETDIDKRFFGI